MIRRLSVFGLIVVLSGCSHATVEDYSKNTPKMDIRRYFNGDVKAEGIFFTRAGKAQPQFVIAMKGAWQGDNGTLSEHIVYNDGFAQDRLWNIHVVDDHTITATAADAVGTASGQQNGNAFNMRYTLRVPSHTDKSTTHIVDMDDWIFLLDDKTGINRVQMSKYGLDIGELIITFRKL